jgi:hypothetical protein
MVKPRVFAALAAYAQIAHAACPYMDGDASVSNPHVKRDDSYATPSNTNEFMAKFEVNDTDSYITTNAGGPIEDQESLSAGERGPTLLEDFVFREKITHFGMNGLRSNGCPLVNIGTQTTSGFLNAQYMRAELARTVYSHPTATGRTLLGHRS